VVPTGQGKRAIPAIARRRRNHAHSMLTVPDRWPLVVVEQPPASVLCPRFVPALRCLSAPREVPLRCPCLLPRIVHHLVGTSRLNVGKESFSIGSLYMISCAGDCGRPPSEMHGVSAIQSTFVCSALFCSILHPRKCGYDAGISRNAWSQPVVRRQPSP